MSSRVTAILSGGDRDGKTLDYSFKEIKNHIDLPRPGDGWNVDRYIKSPNHAIVVSETTGRELVVYVFQQTLEFDRPEQAR